MIFEVNTWYEPIEMATESMQMQLNSAVQTLVEAAKPEDEFFLLSYNFRTASVDVVRRQYQTMEGLVSVGPISGLTSLEQVIMAGIQKLKGKTEKRGLAMVTSVTDLQISRAYDLLSKVENLSDLPGLQFYTLKREAGIKPKESSKSAKDFSQKSYVVEDIGEIGYYLDLVYSDLRSQYILGYPPTKRRPAGKALNVKVEVESRRGFPSLTVRQSKPYYAQLP